MREAFHVVSPCRTMTTSVNSPAASPPTVEADDDDIPRPAPEASTQQRICGVVGPVRRAAATLMAEGGAARGAIEGAGGGRSVMVGRRQSISGARAADSELVVRESRDHQKVFRWAGFWQDC